jgi:cyclase
LFGKRDVDELMLLDVNARSKEQTISLDVIRSFATHLQVPFSVGGGISTIGNIADCIRNGAEKIVLGTAAITKPNLISEAASIFGTQAVTVSLAIRGGPTGCAFVDSGSTPLREKIPAIIRRFCSSGAGELIIQDIDREGLLSGFDLTLLDLVLEHSTIPVIVSGGCASYIDALNAAKKGASGIAVGALFQYTENTPLGMRRYLKDNGIRVRKTV